MTTDKSKFIQSQYKPVSSNDHADMCIVRNLISDQLCMEKRLSIYSIDVYAYLKTHHHAHVCSVIDYWKEGEQLVVIEELLSGTTLEYLLENDLLNEMQKKNILNQVLDGLSFLHHADPPIIHRDLKPSNLMVSSSLEAKIMDYNAAKRYKQGESKDTVLIGTEGSAAPEQYGFGASDIRTDIYAAGVLIRTLFPADAKMCAIADKASALSPDNRYQCVEDIQNALKGSSMHAGCINIPGFRSGKPFNMVLSSIAYLFLIFYCLSFPVSSNGVPADSLHTAATHIGALVICFALIDLFTNWSGIYQKLPWMKSSRRLWKILGYLISVLFIILFFGFLIGIPVEMIAS